jgi:hypothetical protein
MDAMITATDGARGNCINCGKLTRNISLTFESWMCDEQCDNEKFREYMEATRI